MHPLNFYSAIWAVTIIEPMFDHTNGNQTGVSQRTITSADGYIAMSGEPQGVVFKAEDESTRTIPWWRVLEIMERSEGGA